MGDLAQLDSGLVTSVGPVPFEDIADAVDFAYRTMPVFPTVPSPGTGPRSLLGQAVDGLAGVEARRSGLLRLDDSFDPCAAIEASEAGAVALGAGFDMFRGFVDRLAGHAAGTPLFVGVRLPVLGPVTTALGFRAAGVDDRTAVALAGSLVARRAVRMLAEVRAALPDHVVMVCMNESGLVGAMHPTFPLDPEVTQGLLQRVVDALDAQAAAGPLLIGAHVPGRSDWDTVVASGVSVLSVPVTAGLPGWAATLADFLQRGGRVAWGAVPVDQPLGSGEELLWRRLSSVWCDLVAEGVDPLALRRRSLVSPVDGLGHFGPSQAELVVDLLGSLSVRIARQTLAARLSLGA